jgi:hypothetical protein
VQAWDVRNSCKHNGAVLPLSAAPVGRGADGVDAELAEFGNLMMMMMMMMIKSCTLIGHVTRTMDNTCTCATCVPSKGGSP